MCGMYAANGKHKYSRGNTVDLCQVGPKMLFVSTSHCKISNLKTKPVGTIFTSLAEVCCCKIPSMSD